jgi:predicted nucleotidyltransferase/DNA-binding HxlR family transcriptional regulator
VNEHSSNRNTSFVETENTIIPKVSHYLEKKGWKITSQSKLRGRRIDIVATKGSDITAIEVKGSSGDMSRGIEQALHQKKSASFSYLAIPKNRSDDTIIKSCKNLGIGLLLVNDAVKEALAPTKNNVLPSVRNIVFGQKKKPQKPVLIKSSLEYLFRSRAQVLILKLLFMNSTREFHANEIARRVEIAPSTVTKEMPQLQNIGLISRRAQGPLVFYKINNKSTIFDEMKRIFLKFEMLDQVLAKGFSDKDIKYALIYGSFAKGEESESSDIDLLVIGGIDEDSMIKSVSRAERMSGREINFVLWNDKDFAERVRKNIPLIKEIARTPILMIVGDKDEFKRIIEKESS